MQDRIGDLRQVVAERNAGFVDVLPASSSVFSSGAKNAGFDIEAQLGIQNQKNAAKEPLFMEEYFAQINLIKTGISNISTSMAQIRELKQQLIQTATPEREKEISQRTAQCIQETNRSVLAIKNALERLKTENDVFISRSSDSSEARIRENMHSALMRKFREVLSEYQAIQTEYKKAVQSRIERQVRIVYPEASDYELKEMTQASDSAAAQAIYQQITGASESLQNAVAEIQDKYRDVKRLEQSVVELHQMFVDLATLVDAQGEMLDQIEFSVANAKDYTEKADAGLVVARKGQKKASKRMCWISVCIVIVAVVIMLPVVVFLSN